MSKTIAFRSNVVPFFSLALALAVSASAGGCSSEDYSVPEPVPGTGDEQSPPKETASSSGEPTTPKTETPAPAPLSEADAGADGAVDGDAAPAACLKKRLSTACVSDTECCSGSCNSELCVPPAGTCTTTTS